jgi:cytochrome c556
MGSMSGKWVRAAVFAALGVGVAVLSVDAGATAAQKGDKDKTPTISEIMTKGHKGTDAYLAKIGSAAKGGKWDDAKEAAKGLNYFGETLVKLTPTKGDKASWEKMAKKYGENTKAVYDAVEKKDAAATQAGLKAIQGSCGGCHKAHK